MALSPGTRLGPYEVLSSLGAGGMGEVYRAKDHKLGRQVAIKVLPDDLSGDRERLQRFEREARAASSLNHPNTVTIHDIDEHDGTHFIAMELVEGQTLGERLAEGRLPTDEMLRIASQVAQGLAKAHAAGIVHRDLKPGNIMITDDGLVKILDFGLAKLTSAGVEEVSALTTVPEVTRTGVVLGTVPYMSPEQASGRPVDFRSDQFSFGSILYEMATGRRAFERETAPQTLAAILEASPPSVSALNDRVPDTMVRLIVRCLSRDPGGRYDSTGDLAKELARGGPADAASRGSREWWPIAAVAALAVVVVGVLYWSVSRPQASQSGERPVSPLVPVPLTSYPGREAEPTFSPDGSQVAFSWDGESQDNRDIYVKAIGSEQPFRLTDDPAMEGSPAWSPDGRQVALLRARAGGGSEVLLIPPTGGAVRQVGLVASPVDGGLSWSPDGRRLAVLDHPRDEGPAPGVFLLDTSDGSRTRLTSPPVQTTRGDSRPSFSPDGQTVAFFREDGRIHLVPAAGGEPRALTSVLWRSRVAWIPSGSEIIFSAIPVTPEEGETRPSQGYSGSPVLWRMNVDGQGTRQVAGTANAREVAVASAGHRLAYTRHSSRWDIWRIDLQSSGTGEGPVPLLASTRIDGNPQLSNDGRRIAFTSSRSGVNEIWVADSEGGDLLRLTDLGESGEAGSPRWSPSGQAIAFDFRSEGEGRDYDVFTVGTSGGSPRRVTASPSRDVTPSWSQDGRWIYFSSDRTGRWQVWKLAFDARDGGSALQVTQGGGFAPTESPDGEYVYFSRRHSFPEDPENAVWRVPVQGGKEEEVVKSLRSSWGNWDVTDEGVYFVDDDASPGDARWVIKSFRFDDGSIDELAGLAFEPSLGGPGFSVSSDGRWALCMLREADSDLMLVEDFR